MFKKVIVVVGLVVLIFTGAHLLMESSDSFKQAEIFLKGCNDVIESVGEVSRTSLVPLLSSVRFGGHEGNARYHVKVVGSKGVAEGVVTLVKIEGVWNVTKAYLVLQNSDVVILKQ